jgi:hypothetical protein
MLYHLSHSASPFCFRYFTGRVSCFCLGWPGTQSSYIHFLHSWDDKCTLPHPAFSVKTGLENFLPRLPGTPILLISISRVARIIGVSHCTGLILKFLKPTQWLICSASCVTFWLCLMFFTATSSCRFWQYKRGDISSQRLRSYDGCYIKRRRKNCCNFLRLYFYY